MKEIIKLCNKFATMNSIQQKSKNNFYIGYLYDQLRKNKNLRILLLMNIPFGPLVQSTEKFILNPEKITRQKIPPKWKVFFKNDV